MVNALQIFARAERQFLRDELEWFNSGARFMSPSGDDITSIKRNELEARLDQVSKALASQGET